MSKFDRRVKKLEQVAGMWRRTFVVDLTREGPKVEAALAARGITARPSDLIIVLRDIVAESRAAIEAGKGPRDAALEGNA